MDDYTLAKRLFNGKNGSNSNSDSALDNTVTTFEALALTDSVEGYVTIDMGGMVTSGDNSQGVVVPTTVVVKKGQTVIVQNSGGSLVVIGVIGGGDGMKDDILNDVQDDIDKQITEKGEEIREEVKEELAPLENAFDEFKQNHQLTDADINKIVTDTKTEFGVEISGAIETANEAYNQTTILNQTVEDIQLSAEEHYKNYDAGFLDFESRITLNSTNIATEVSDRKEAVSGALSEAKSYTDQSADKISQTVESNVKNSIGDTYATKSEVTQTADSITTTFEKELAVVESTANSAKTTANNASSTANTANSGVTTLKTYIRESTAGIEVGRSSGKYKALVNSSGSFDVLDSSGSTIFKLRSIGDGTANLYTGGYGISFTNSGHSSIIMSRTGGITIGLNSAGVLLQNGSYGGACYATSNGGSYLTGSALLYANSGGSTGTIYLDQSVSNFAMIDIVVGDTRYNTIRVYKPAGSLVCLSQEVYSNSQNTLYVNTEVVSISGSTISRNYQNRYCGQSDIMNNGNTNNVANRPINIKYVIGWGC